MYGTSAARLRSVGVIGYGAIAREVVASLSHGSAGSWRVSGVLRRSHSPDDPDAGWRFVRTLDELLATRPDVVADLATHETLRSYGPPILRRGVDLVTTNAGALWDEDLRAELLAAASRGGARLTLASGAIGGLDILEAASIAGISSIHYTARKPLAAVARHNLPEGADSGPHVLFRGMAQEACRLFPKSVNVAALIALAGVGFERTEVEIVADPAVTRNCHQVTVEGPWGSMRLDIEAVPSVGNPTTSMIVACSVIRSLRRAGATMLLG